MRTLKDISRKTYKHEKKDGFRVYELDTDQGTTATPEAFRQRIIAKLEKADESTSNRKKEYILLP